ncbi:ribonuclease HI [bacterium endosymbiont of Pedicinus badii]|uniref:ribonuclease HI n=1 Tax=bacterium endosymbiont of Pedicinus badii TaxID=1719126 RepID=UPI0009BB1151|nr:ribonuclease HI [bacterium endosymbiont of Pedicinus badii]OQM34276.1 ribonuclease H [bacterium endosymbiont of Pedicinus badii]
MYKKVEIFIDGSCLNNPGPGGLGILFKYRNYNRTFSKGFKNTTNNRMELTAAIYAIKFLKFPCKISISTDSRYLYDGITKWIYVWKEKNWKNSRKKFIKNADLWKNLLSCSKNHILCWNWIKSHNRIKENEICDKIAKNAAKKYRIK